MKKLLALTLALCMLCTATPCGAEAPKNYLPGEYSATEHGFGGDIVATVKVTEDRIESLSIIGDAETAGIGAEAVKTLCAAILENGSPTGVDVVAGATITSHAALKAATAAFSAASGQAIEAPVATEARDGVYNATAPSYKRSGGTVDTVTLDVTFAGGAITAIDVKNCGDTPAIGGMAFDQLRETIVREQCLGIDTVAGATVSSAGFLAAVADAIGQAGGNADEWRARSIEPRKAEKVELEADIVVVGAGIAGLSATLEAANSGAKVILVEKQAVLGSSTTRSEGYVQAANTQLQKENGVTDDVESLYKDIMQVYESEPMVEPELIQRAAYESTELIDFLLDGGVVFNHLEAISKNPPRNVPRNHCVQGGGGGITSNLYKTAVARGATVLMGTPCTDLIMDGKAVVGIKATNAYGDDIAIHAKSVILCAGSYTSNKALLTELHPLLVPEAVSGSGDGDAYYLSLQANADIVKLDYIQMMFYFFSTKLTGWPSVIPGAPATSMITPASNVIFLDGGGKRVANEDEFCFDYIEKNWENKYIEGWTLVGKTFAAQHPDVIEIAMSSELGSRPGRMGYMGDTLEDVAAQAGLDAQIVTATAARYNELCDLGEDLDFNKPAQYMERVDAPYYLLRMPMVCTDGYDGARINKDAQVIDVDGNIIPGFYAAGSCAVGQMSSVRYYGCGTSLLIGGVYGRAAARHAVHSLAQ
ncbi:MAG: FAD-dependent oxidoreductase [Clostridia bacterium]